LRRAKKTSPSILDGDVRPALNLLLRLAEFLPKDSLNYFPGYRGDLPKGEHIEISFGVHVPLMK
jgi:hypothetical protein